MLRVKTGTYPKSRHQYLDHASDMFLFASGLDEEIKQFADSSILRAILDQGCDPKEYEQQYEASLREAERGSVQHYISESENLVSLHTQVMHTFSLAIPQALIKSPHRCPFDLC